MRPVALLLPALFAALPLPARADRDIVYAARYYTPPGSHGTSHFHLYRINPDGTGRTQITFGKQDDDNPQWSPDGRWIAFDRGNSLRLLDTRTGRIRKLFSYGPDSMGGFLWQPRRWSPDGRTISMVHEDEHGHSSVIFLAVSNGRVRTLAGANQLSWLPDGRQAEVDWDNQSVVYDLRTNSTRTIRYSDSSVGPVGDLPIWMSDSIRVGWNGLDPTSGLNTLSATTSQGKLVWQAKLKDGFDLPTNLIRVPRYPNQWVCATQSFNSTTGDVYDFSLLTLPGGYVQDLGRGNDFSISGDGHRYAVAAERDTSYYARWKDGLPRMVWTAPLYVGRLSTGEKRKITCGLVIVTGVDWRKRQGR